MDAERLVINDEGRSRHLPPLEAWKEPDRWIDLSSGTVRVDIKKPFLPVDDRKFVIPDEAVRFMIDMFFWEDYDWPYDPTDKETAPDDHHFYHYRRYYKPDVNNGSQIPSEFRGLPTSIGRMPRQLHNTIHSLTKPPLMPKRQDMAGYLDSYNLAVRAFQKSFNHINRLILNPNSVKFNPDLIDALPRSLDPIAEAFIDGFFKHHFASYSAAIEEVDGLVEANKRSVHVLDDAHVVEFAHALGNAATQHFRDFTPLLQAA